MNDGLKLEFPQEKHKIIYEKLIKEWGEIEKIPTSPQRLFVGENYEEFIDKVKNDVDNNENGVNSHLYFLIYKNVIVGGIQVRHNISHPNLIENGGHIGYGISPKYRKKGFGSKMLKLCLIEVKNMGIDKVLITCDLDNFGSSKIIQKNGGIFERVTKDGKRNRYWVKL